MRNSRFSRRAMLKGSVIAGGALAFPSVVPSSVFGQNAPSNRVNLAAIGVGGRGTDNCRHRFLPLENARIIVACDVRKASRESFCAIANEAYKGDFCKPMADFRQVLTRGDIDGVVISTPDHWHVPIAYAAAKAKKDIYCEKPLSIALAWSFRLREMIEQNKIVFQYGTQQRSDQGQFRRACELVRNGYIGQVKSVDVWSPDMSSQFGSASVKPYGSNQKVAVPPNFDYDMWIGPAPMKDYTADRCTCYGAYHIYDYALGFIAGWAVHPLDIAQWGLGMDHTSPVRYEGTGTVPPEGSLWNSIESWDVTCTYANGIPVRNMGHRVAEPVVKKYHVVWRDHGTTFHGEKGWISVDRTGLYASDKAIQSVQIKAGEQQLYASTWHARNFVECIKSRQPTINPIGPAIRVDTISHLCDMAIRLGRTIRWDPEKEQVVGDAEATRMMDRPMRAPWAMA